MKTNTFITWFWILYIPLCILFYNRVNGWVDEIMTLVLALFTLTKLSRRSSKKARREIAVYAALMAFYFVYSIFLRINTTNALLLDFQQQVRPYVVFYCTYLLAPVLRKRQQRLLMRVLVTVVILFFWYNPNVVTVGATGGETTPVIGQAALLLSLLYVMYWGTDGNKRWWALAILTIGLLSGKSKFFGEYVAFIGVFFFLKNRLQLNSIKTAVQVGILALLVVAVTWTKFNAYYVEGFDQEEARQMNARPATYTVGRTIMFHDYIPFGSGLASFATNAAAVHYSPLYPKYKLDNIWGLAKDNPMFLADAFYPTLAEFGIVGLFFFLWFWVRRYQEVYRAIDLRYYKVGLMCILALALESTADTSYLSGKGMGYFMLLAMCIRIGTVEKKGRKRILIINREIAEREQAQKASAETEQASA